MFLHKYICLLSISLFLVSSTAFAQQAHCYTEEYFQKNYASDPALLERVKNFQTQIASLPAMKTQSDVYTIPVVVHILYNNSSENLDDDRIFSQLNALNEDYRRLNTDTVETPSEFQSVAADIQIEFCLAIFDPNGDSTGGITRTFTEADTFGLENTMKHGSTGGIDAWDPDSYLNIWVCDLQDNILGFSSLPGSSDTENDGIVINYKFFGDGFGAISPYNLGRTCTHEVGHYLGLTHIWGDDADNCSGSDLVADTPNQQKETYGCPSFPLTDGCSPESPGIMFMNYMDYTDDGCMNIFTEGQKARMRNTLETERSSLLLSAAGCNDIVPIPGAIAELLINPNPADEGVTITVNNFQGTQLQFAIYNSLGQLLLVQDDEPAVVANKYFDLSSLPPGMYVASAFNGTYLLAAKFFID